MLFSIIIPSYNRASFLPRAIQSVISQQYENWELIIIDDGSTDNTKEVVAPFLSDNRIKYIYQTNAERSAARNHGIKLSKGDFITFMDSDEYLLVSHLLKLKEGITKNNLKNGAYTFDIGFDYPEDSTHNYTRFSKELQNPINPNDLIGFIIGAPQLCISKVILNKFNFNINIRIGEDTELLFRILSNYPFFYIPGEPTVFEIEHINRSVKNRSASSLQQLETLKIMFSENHPANKVDKSLKNKLVSEVYFNASIDYFKEYKTKALKYIILSLFKDPFGDKTLFKLNLLCSFILLRKKRINKLLN